MPSLLGCSSSDVDFEDASQPHSEVSSGRAAGFGLKINRETVVADALPPWIAYRTVFLPLTVLLSSGCLWGASYAEDRSSSWQQPDAYDALEAGSERGGYRIQPNEALPGFSRHATPWDGVNRTLVAAHWPVGPYGERSREDISFRIEFVGEDLAHVSRYIGVGDDTETMRPLFVEFLRNATDASPAQIDAWFSEYVHDGRYNVEVRGPFKVGAVYETFSTQPGETGMEQWDQWEFVFSMESKSATRTTGDVTHTFHFGVGGLCSYVRKGPSNLADADLGPLVFEEFRRLGLGEAKADALRFEHIHGD